MQSVVIAYALTMAILIPASGWLADRFGTRRVFFSALERDRRQPPAPPEPELAP